MDLEAATLEGEKRHSIILGQGGRLAEAEVVAEGEVQCSHSDTDQVQGGEDLGWVY